MQNTQEYPIKNKSTLVDVLLDQQQTKEHTCGAVITPFKPK